MQWQPVPAGIGMRTQLAYLSGCAADRRRRRHAARASGERAGALLLAVVLSACGCVALHLPIVHRRGLRTSVRGTAPAEIGFLTTGGSRCSRRTPGSMRRTLADWSRGCSRAPAPSCSAARISTTSISPPTMVPGVDSAYPDCSGPRPPGPGISRRVSRWSAAFRRGSRPR